MEPGGKRTSDDDEKSARRWIDGLCMDAVFRVPQVYVCKLRLRW